MIEKYYCVYFADARKGHSSQVLFSHSIIKARSALAAKARMERRIQTSRERYTNNDDNSFGYDERSEVLFAEHIFGRFIYYYDDIMGSTRCRLWVGDDLVAPDDSDLS